MAQHQNNRRRGDTLDIGYSQGRQSNNASQQNARSGNLGHGDEHPPPAVDQSRGFPDRRGQEGQYGTSPENRYGNSPTNPYAKNPGASQGMGEPWRDEAAGEGQPDDGQAQKHRGGAAASSKGKGAGK